MAAPFTWSAHRRQASSAVRATAPGPLRWPDIECTSRVLLVADYRFLVTLLIPARRDRLIAHLIAT
jgi:hypothetical protein